MISEITVTEDDAEMSIERQGNYVTFKIVNGDEEVREIRLNDSDAVDLANMLYSLCGMGTRDDN
jgi:hypothetical protein